VSPAVEVRDVRKIYRRFSRRKQFATLKSALLSRTLIGDLRRDDALEALKGVSFDVSRGRSFGIIGRNGSGKSTLLKLIAGIGRPSAGTVRVDGRVSALIELGAGFHPEISGRENVFINGLMLGLSKREIQRRFEEIVRFAELEPFIDAPVKTYSSGMYVRLGFAVAIHVDPDVLLVDEVLAVGDEGFTHKCLDKFAEFRRRGRTVILVTHSLDLVERFCEEALWLDEGRVRAEGDPRRIVDEYRLDVARIENAQMAAAAAVAAGRAASIPARGRAPEASEAEAPGPPAAPPPPDVVSTAADPEEAGSAAAGSAEEQNGRPEAPADMFRAVEGRWGSREAEITEVRLLDARDQPSHVFESGGAMTVCLRVHAPAPLGDVVFGVGLFNAEGICCYGTNTGIEQAVRGVLHGEAEVRFVVDNLDLVAGAYRLDVAVHRANGVPYDYHRLLYSFRVTSRIADVGIFRPRHRWVISGIGSGESPS